MERVEISLRVQNNFREKQFYHHLLKLSAWLMLHEFLYDVLASGDVFFW